MGSASVRWSHQTISGASKLVSLSIIDTRLSLLMRWNLQDFPKAVLNDRTWLIRTSTTLAVSAKMHVKSRHRHWSGDGEKSFYVYLCLTLHWTRMYLVGDVLFSRSRRSHESCKFSNQRVGLWKAVAQTGQFTSSTDGLYVASSNVWWPNGTLSMFSVFITFNQSVSQSIY